MHVDLTVPTSTWESAMTRPIVLVVLLTFASGCTIDQICFPDYQDCPTDETGGDEGLYCSAPLPNGRWHCLLNDPSDFRVKKAIDDGLLVPWTEEGSCPHHGREWDTLRRVDPVVNAAPPLRAAECSDTPLQVTYHFSICLPDKAVWSSGHPNGAIGMAGGDPWSTNCTTPEPYLYTHDYVLAVPCARGVTCLGFDTECACKCEEPWDCGAMQDYLETYYGEDQYGLIPGGWESACTGYPWEWDQWAYGVGSYQGTSCEWNMPGPMPGDVPQPLQDIIDDITCVESTCTLAETLIDDVLASPGLVAGSSIIAFDRAAIEIGECNHVCTALGLVAGDRIVALGLTAQDPTDPAAWMRAHDELFAGRTEATIATDTHVYVLTLVLEE
jgi:hypothetical protein